MESRVAEYKFPKQMRLTAGIGWTYRQRPLIRADILCTTRNLGALIIFTVCFTVTAPSFQTTVIANKKYI